MKITVKPLYSLILTVQAGDKREDPGSLMFPFLVDLHQAKIKWKHKWGMSSHCQEALNKTSCFSIDLWGHRKEEGEKGKG